MRLRAATQKRVRGRPHYEHVHRAVVAHPAEGVGIDMEHGASARGLVWSRAPGNNNNNIMRALHIE